MSLIELRDISRRFGRVQALERVSLSLPAGQVHGLLGENGAGKSTLMNILYGLLPPDEGHILIAGSPVPLRSPAEAIAAGIGMVHQHFMLADGLTVLENVLLGDRRQPQWLNRSQAARKLTALADDLGFPVDPHARVESLSVGQQQRLEILKALHRDARTLILDEPTAVLTPQETDQLLAAMARLRQQGKSIVFISHKLSEVMRICNDITVLSRGKVVWSGRRSETTPEQLAHRMVGDAPSGARISLARSARANPQQEPAPVLKVESVFAVGLHDISIPLGSEILGIAGVDGNGQKELAEVLVGLRRVTSGRITLGGHDLTQLGVHARTALGVAHIPNDRKREGLVPPMSIAQNIALKHHRSPPFSRMGVLSRNGTRQLATSLVRRFDVRTPSPDIPVAALSGGNQQKVVLARELAVVTPRLIVAMNPTRGLDIAATRAVHEELLRQRDAGCAILLISSELDELLALSDRLAVLYRGRLTFTRFPDDTVEQIGRLMAGIAA